MEQGRFGNNRSAFHFQFHTQVQTFQAASGSPLRLLRLPARTSGASADTRWLPSVAR